MHSQKFPVDEHSEDSDGQEGSETTPIEISLRIDVTETDVSAS